MSDPETRDKLATLLRDECPIVSICRSLKRPPKCRYLGFTNGCDSCTYHWASIVDDMLHEAGSRRAAFEKESEARKVAEGMLDKIMWTITGDEGLLDLMRAHILAKDASDAADKEMDGVETQGGREG